MVRSSCSRPLASIIAAATVLMPVVIAAQPLPPAAPASTNYTVRAVRIDPSEAPKIDGDLSDPVWAKAAILDNFPQMEPNPGQPATEKTVLRILYDENNLYFGVYLYDDEPDKIAVRRMTRDGPVFAEDEFRIVLAPNMTRRDAYEFIVGPAGGREDALVQNNTNDLTRWNTIWLARSRVVADGWVAEIAIPFRDFSYDPARTDWGFDFVSVIRRKAERDRWASHSPTIAISDISQAGNLTVIPVTNISLVLIL